MLHLSFGRGPARAPGAGEAVSALEVVPAALGVKAWLCEQLPLPLVKDDGKVPAHPRDAGQLAEEADELLAAA